MGKRGIVYSGIYDSPPVVPHWQNCLIIRVLIFAEGLIVAEISGRYFRHIVRRGVFLRRRFYLPAADDWSTLASALTSFCVPRF